MTINKVSGGGKLTLFLGGRLDTKSAPAFLEDITNCSENYDELAFLLPPIKKPSQIMKSEKVTQ